MLKGVYHFLLQHYFSEGIDLFLLSFNIKVSLLPLQPYILKSISFYAINSEVGIMVGIQNNPLRTSTTLIMRLCWCV